MVTRRGLLVGLSSVSATTSGCVDLGSSPAEFELSEIYVESRSAEPHDATVAVEDAEDVVFMDSIEVSPAQWDDDDLVREGGAIVEAPVDGPGSYDVHVRIDDGPIHTTTAETTQAEGGCVSVRPVIGREGGFHFEYAYESNCS